MAVGWLLVVYAATIGNAARKIHIMPSTGIKVSREALIHTIEEAIAASEDQYEIDKRKYQRDLGRYKTTIKTLLVNAVQSLELDLDDSFFNQITSGYGGSVVLSCSERKPYPPKRKIDPVQAKADINILKMGVDDTMMLAQTSDFHKYLHG